MSNHSVPAYRLRQLQQQQAARQDAVASMPQLPTPLLDALLESDARSLLLTPKFFVFLQILLDEIAIHPAEFPYPLQISVDPSVWLLSSLPWALRVYRIPEQGAADVIGLRMELGTWQQVFRLPIAELPAGDEKAMSLWTVIASQLQQAMPQLPIAPALQFFLAQELMCILCYLSEVEFSLPVTDQLKFGLKLEEQGETAHPVKMAEQCDKGCQN